MGDDRAVAIGKKTMLLGVVLVVVGMIGLLAPLIPAAIAAVYHWALSLPSWAATASLPELFAGLMNAGVVLLAVGVSIYATFSKSGDEIDLPDGPL